MNKNSKWYNPDWPDYYCIECDSLYQLFVDGLCSSCRVVELLPDNNEKLKNKAFAEEWRESRKEKPNQTKISKPKNKYFN